MLSLVKNVGALIIGTLLGSLVVHSCVPQAEAGPSLSIQIVQAPDGSTCYVAVGPRGNARAMSCR